MKRFWTEGVRDAFIQNAGAMAGVAGFALLIIALFYPWLSQIML